jgi:hypothetical protein
LVWFGAIEFIYFLLEVAADWVFFSRLLQTHKAIDKGSLNKE